MKWYGHGLHMDEKIISFGISKMETVNK
jgi:hypothetical protein